MCFPSVFAFNWIPCHGYANIFNFKCRFHTHAPAFSCRSLVSSVHVSRGKKIGGIAKNFFTVYNKTQPERMPRDVFFFF